MKSPLNKKDLIPNEYNKGYDFYKGLYPNFNMDYYKFYRIMDAKITRKDGVFEPLPADGDILGGLGERENYPFTMQYSRRDVKGGVVLRAYRENTMARLQIRPSIRSRQAAEFRRNGLLALRNRLRIYILFLQNSRRLLRGQWAIPFGVSELIIAFLNYRGGFLFQFDPAGDTIAFPSPRSWSFADTFLKLHANAVQDAYPLIASAIGEAAAAELRAFAKLLEAKAAKLLEEDFSTQFSVGLMNKDLALSRQLAAELKVPALMLAQAKELFVMGMNRGYQDEDVSAMLKLYSHF